MRKIIIIKEFYSRAKGVSLVLGIIMFFSIFILCWVQASYDYNMKDIYFIDKCVGNADLYMRYTSWIDTENTVELINKLNHTDGIKSVLYTVEVYMEDNDESYKITYCPEELINILFDCSINSESDGGSLECISTYNNTIEGEELKVKRCNTSLQYSLKIKNSFNSDKNTLVFNHSGDALTVNSLIATNETIYVPVSDIKDILLDNYTFVGFNCYVFYEDNISDNEIEDIRDSVSEDYTVDTIQNIISNSKVSILKFNVMLPMFFGDTRYSEMKKKAHKALQQVGLDDVYKKKANELSGGQRQRVAIARAIVNSPSYLLADEPTGALDSVTSTDIVNLLKDINKNGTTVIIVTHDDYVAENCKTIIRIHDGKIV